MHRTYLPFVARFTLVAWCAFTVSAVFAQTTPSGEPALDGRAVRDASNPMRMIIEASKLKLRKSEPDSSVAPDKRMPRAGAAPAAVVPQPAVAKAVEPASAPAASKPRVAAEKRETEPKVAAVPPAAPQATPPVAPPPAAASKPEPLPALPASPATALAASAASIKLASAKPAAPIAKPVPLKLLSTVAPELPGNVMRRLRGNVEVVVGFTVNPDGSVSNVVVRTSPMKDLDAAVIEAVQQWRYEPIGEAREHAVQLLVRPGL